jgi:hypothetical protein
MTRVKAFDMEVTLRLLAEMTPANLTGLSFADLEWILADFILSWGQRLRFDPATWPPPDERAHFHRFGQRYSPFSTAADFPAVTPDQVRTLAAAFTGHALYILLLDEIIDAPETAPAAAKLALQHLLSHSQRWYRAIFPADSLFWPRVEQRALTTTRAMWEEYYQHNGTVRPFSLDQFRRIAADKVAIAQINPIGLAVLNGAPELIPDLAMCWDAIGLAATVLDDIRDWRRDYEASNFTYLLTQVLLSPPFQAQVEAGHLPPVQEVGTALFCSNLMESLYDLACVELEAAAYHAESINCPALAGLLQLLLTQLQDECNDLTQRKLIALLTTA